MLGEQPLYRTRSWKQLERAEVRRGKRETWYRKGGFDSVIFVPATPRSQLRNQFMREINEKGFRVKVDEQSGLIIRQMLQRSETFKERQCNNTDCLICSIRGKGSCRSTGVTYELVCHIFAAISTSEKHPGVLTLAVKNISEPLNSARKVLFCGDVAVIFMQVTSQASP